MKPLHLQEKEHFLKLFQQEDIDRFEDRFNILEVFLQTERHVTVDELNGLLSSNGYSFQRDFLKSTLQMMCRYGFAQKITFENEPTRYEHRHLGQHHDHLICTKCGKIDEFNNPDIETLQNKIATLHGFYILQHKMEIYGICGECRADREETLTLESARPGEKVVIKDFSGGAVVKMRLMSMGLRRGDVVEVITNQKNGQLVIALEHKRYSLGRGFARKIRVHTASVS